MNIPRDKMQQKDAYARKWFRNFGYTFEQVNKKLKKTFGTGMDPARLKRIQDRKSVKGYRRPSIKKVEKIARDHVAEVVYETVELEDTELADSPPQPHINDIMREFIRKEIKKLLREILTKI